MKITIYSKDDSDGLRRESMDINDIYVLGVNPLCECPEDAIIGRDLVSCNDVLGFMKKAYEAGKNGEELIEEFKEMQD